MRDLDDDIPVPDIPIYVFVIIGCVAALLAGSQLLGLWLTGFKKPTPSEPVYSRILHDKPSSFTLASAGEVALRGPPAVAARVSGKVRRFEEKRSLEGIKEPEDIEKGKQTEETKDIEENQRCHQEN